MQVPSQVSLESSVAAAGCTGGSSGPAGDASTSGLVPVPVRAFSLVSLLEKRPAACVARVSAA